MTSRSGRRFTRWTRPTIALLLCASARASWEIAASPIVPWELAAGSAACIALGICSVRIVGTGSEALVERLGKYHRRLEPGLNLILPGIESVSAHMSTREQVLDVPPQPCITSDNAPLSADAVVCVYGRWSSSCQRTKGSRR